MGMSFASQLGFDGPVKGLGVVSVFAKTGSGSSPDLCHKCQTFKPCFCSGTERKSGKYADGLGEDDEAGTKGFFEQAEGDPANSPETQALASTLERLIKAGKFEDAYDAVLEHLDYMSGSGASEAEWLNYLLLADEVADHMRATGDAYLIYKAEKLDFMTARPGSQNPDALPDAIHEPLALLSLQDMKQLALQRNGYDVDEPQPAVPVYQPANNKVHFAPVAGFAAA